MRSALDDVMVLMEQAALKLPTDKLAGLARAIPDDDLADMVRNNTDLRRFALMVLVQEQLGGELRAQMGKRRNPNGRSKPRAASRTSRSNGAHKQRPTERLRAESARKGTGKGGDTTGGAGEKKRVAIIGALERAGTDGLKGPEIADAVGLTRIQISAHLTRLRDEGQIRSTGAKAGTRWYAA